MKALLRKLPNTTPDLAAFGPLLDTDDQKTCTVIVNHENRRDPGVHFHVYAPFFIVEENYDRETRYKWFEWSVNHCWSLAGLMGANTFFINAKFDDSRRASQRREYLASVLRFMDEMDAIGPRFSLLAKTDVMSNLGLALHYGCLEDLGFDVRHPSAKMLRAAIEQFLKSQ